ncbi:low temperature requirement protein A [Micromonospora sp. NPDC051006]|uniref:low temperature requirement protein A n=1 Tax=Micromonospora sp. NPDC051006 TaxID=3364283 RepID=UPI0037B136E2
MTTGGSTELVRRPDGSARATLLELLFDVVFVAALALVSMLVAERESWTGGAQILLTLMAIWWTWSITATTTDFYDPDQRPLQAILMVTMLGSVATAAALPLASDGHALIFAVAYVIPHLVRGVILVSVLRQHRHRLAEQRAARFLFWFLVSGGFWIAGALLPDRLQWPLWITAVVIDYLSAAARYPTPGLGRVPVGQYSQTSDHLGERYQQFMILALGDIILVPTLEISSSGFAAARLAAFLIAFITMLLLWQIYVFGANAFLHTSSARLLGRATRLGPYTHLVMVVGIVCTAAGFDLVIIRPTGDTPVRWLVLLFGGPAVFLIGRTLFTYLITGVLAWHRTAWLLLAALMPWAGGWPPVLVAVAAVLVLAGIAVGDVVMSRSMPPVLRGRPG